ncbi:MAG: FAD:protein FMN transferase [Magnetococcales bacterium]|nr:FAD:protein FMN transferase [Magnetococcales bacterium]
MSVADGLVRDGSVPGDRASSPGSAPIPRGLRGLGSGMGKKERWNGRFWFLTMLAIGLAGGCGDAPAPKGPSEGHKSIRLALGTVVTISTWGLEPTREEAAVERAFAEIERIEAMMSPNRSESELSRINDAPRGQWLQASPELVDLLGRALEIQRLSGGAFHPGLLPLVRLWGFSREPAPREPPSPESIDRWRRLADSGDGILIDAAAGRVQLTNAAFGLDLGAIAKGYAIDQAVAVLRREGVDNAIVSGGGDLRLIGAKGREPWVIGLRHPREEGGVIRVSRLSGDRAMMTSGDYERFFMHAGVRFHHILDPATGYPSVSGVISVSVQATDSTLGDALSTAIFVLGRERGIRLLEHFPGCEALIIEEGMKIWQSAGFVAAPHLTESIGVTD